MRCRPRVGDVALAGALGVAVAAQLRWATLDEIRPGWWLSLLLAGAVAAIVSMRRCVRERRRSAG
ncbi:MAG TPA: hypothetical protein GXZ60_10625 [Intrasporangiaceae bacterium]|nr:hypothetical protein [Intrasporangiaceae bacterium]